MDSIATIKSLAPSRNPLNPMGLIALIASKKQDGSRLDSRSVIKTGHIKLIRYNLVLINSTRWNSHHQKLSERICKLHSDNNVNQS